MKHKGLLTIFILMILLCGCDIGSSSTADSSTLLFSIGNYSVTTGQAMLLTEGQKNFVEGTYGSQIWSVTIEDSTFEDFLGDRLKNHIALIFTGAAQGESMGITLSNDEKTLVSAATDYYTNGLSGSTMERLGLDDEGIYRVFYAYKLAQKSHNQIEESSGIEISQDEARVMVLGQIKIYTKGLSDDEAAVKLEKAQAAVERLEKGEDFLQVADVYNEADNLQITVSRDDLPDSEEKVAFSLDFNETSELQENSEGYFIFKCLKTNDKTLSEARREVLLSEARQNYYIEHLKTFLSENPPLWNETVWNDVSIGDDSISADKDFYSVYSMFFPEI